MEKHQVDGGRGVWSLMVATEGGFEGGPRAALTGAKGWSHSGWAARCSSAFVRAPRPPGVCGAQWGGPGVQAPLPENPGIGAPSPPASPSPPRGPGSQPRPTPGNPNVQAPCHPSRHPAHTCLSLYSASSKACPPERGPGRYPRGARGRF